MSYKGLTSSSNARSGANAIDDVDHRSIASSDDWGTPHKPGSWSVEDLNHVALSHESAGETACSHVRGCGGEGKGNKQVTRRVVRFSHQSFASAHSVTEDSPLSVVNSHGNGSPHIHNDSPGLFVSEDEDEDDAAFVVEGQTELNYTNNILRKLSGMDGLKRARAIKANIKDNIAVLEPHGGTSSGRRQVEEDPENQLIKTLRQDQNMKWTDIANFLNQERRQRGEAANLTEAAVYSRFVRNAPRIATAIGEIGFDPKDYIHLRHPNQYSTAQGTGAIGKVGKKRVKNYDNAKELEANMRKQIKEDEHTNLETAEKAEQLMDAVAKVERNFWILVADEMERATTKLYAPNALASRYHAI